MLVATYFGEQEIQWTSAEESTIGLIVSVLIIQLVAIAGARLTVIAVRKWGKYWGVDNTQCYMGGDLLTFILRVQTDAILHHCYFSRACNGGHTNAFSLYLFGLFA